MRSYASYESISCLYFGINFLRFRCLFCETGGDINELSHCDATIYQGLSDLLDSLEVIVGLTMMIYGSRYVWNKMVANQEKQKV